MMKESVATHRLHGCPTKPQQGYILALNILVLALMMVGATYVSQRMSLAVSLAHAEQQRVNDSIALDVARAKVLFLLASVPKSTSGIGNTPRAVALDSRPYRVSPGVVVTLQDVNGLIGINGMGLSGPRRNLIERLLATYSMGSVEADRLIDTLLDYRDEDDYRRINGAERDDYIAAGKGGLIRNDDLKTPTELGRILSWPDVPQIWLEDDPITEHIGIQRFSPFNPNTASWRALVANAGVSSEIAKGLVGRRRSGEIPDISRLAYPGNTGDPFSATGSITTMPSSTTVVTLRMESANWGERFLVTLTPASKISPWHIEYVHRVTLPPLGDAVKTLIELPESAMVYDATAQQQVKLPF